MKSIRNLKDLIINNKYKYILKPLACVLLACLIKFSLIWYFKPDLNDLIQFLFVYVPAGMVTGIMYMGEVPTGTDNTTNYSVNN